MLAEIDALAARLDRWVADAPDWQAADVCQAMMRRLAERTKAMRLRWEAPLLVATLGGTGTGKSSLVNALLGEEIARTGRQRPTTTKPILFCRPDCEPEMLGIDPATVETIHRDLPILRDIVLIDCPDPDTTEGELPADSTLTPTLSTRAREEGDNLARLRAILPHCDVLIVTATQQKYRSARVEEELLAAAPGATLIFVQTHADLEEDVRADWRTLLADRFDPGSIFFLDSLAALRDAQTGVQPRGEFARLVDLLHRELAGSAGPRIRRANYLDLLADALQRCRQKIDAALPPVEQLREAVEEQRRTLTASLAHQMQDELLTNRRPWENRLITQTATRWGFGPFSLVLRVYQGFGALAAGAMLVRARTPAQMALWGSIQGVRAWRHKREENAAEQRFERSAGCWPHDEVRKAALILEGYLTDAGLDRRLVAEEAVYAETERAGSDFIGRASAALEKVVQKLAAAHTGFFTRFRYDVMFVAMVGFILYRMAKNFFYDSWWADTPQPVFGIEFYVAASLWLVLWSLLLLWMLTGRLKKGLRREVQQLGEEWMRTGMAAGLFLGVENACRQIKRHRQDLETLSLRVQELRRDIALPDGLVHQRAS